MTKSTYKENIIVVVISILVIAASVFATLYATGVLFGGDGGDEEGFRNVTFTDAVISCQDKTKSSYGKRIRNLVTDNHSSVYDGKRFVYKIFLKVDLYDRLGDGVSSHYINCFVRASSGKIKTYSILKNDGEEEAEDADGTNMFGVPKRGS